MFYSGVDALCCLSTCAGILWNLSSKDNLKPKLARETLPELTEKILIPLSQKESDSQLSPSEGEIFYNTTGCLRYAVLSTCNHVPFSESTSEDNATAELLLISVSATRNLSSVNEKTRQQMRELQGLVDSLVNYIKSSLDDKSEDKVRRGELKTAMREHGLCCCSTLTLSTPL